MICLYKLTHEKGWGMHTCDDSLSSGDSVRAEVRVRARNVIRCEIMSLVAGGRTATLHYSIQLAPHKRHWHRKQGQPKFTAASVEIQPQVRLQMHTFKNN